MKLLIRSLGGPILLSILVLHASGCAEEVERPAVHPAQGKLLVNGEPAVGARVSLFPSDGKNFDQRGTRPWGKVEADGSFTLRTYQEGDGAPAGDYNVSVIWMANPESLGPSPDKLGGRLADPKTSGLHVTIKEGENQLEPFEIEGVRLAGGRPRRATSKTDVDDVE